MSEHILDAKPYLLSKKYRVQFINYFEDYDPPLEISFDAYSPADVKNVISALSAYYSGDPCECYINGKQAVLDKDWGLL